MFKRICTIAAFVAIGCSAESDDFDYDIDGAEQGLDQDDREIVENLVEAGFPVDYIQIVDGLVYVGSDAVVTLEASREMVGAATRGGERFDPEVDSERFRHYRTNNLLSPSISVICIDGSDFNSNSTLSAALNNAIANYNAEGLSFTMVRTNGSNSGCDAEIIADRVGGFQASAGFPSGGQPYFEINVGSSLANSYGLAITTHVVTHELGHTIGFRHTDFFNRAISCGTGGNEGSGGVGAVYIPGTPTGASFNGSVMNSCFNGGSNGNWTADDEIALQALYGGGGGGPANPNSCVETASCGSQAPGGCWCDAQCVSFGDCCSDGPC
ncbi:MAG: M57 family metalloprotease [Nannocystaceae bacterium]